MYIGEFSNIDQISRFDKQGEELEMVGDISLFGLEIKVAGFLVEDEFALEDQLVILHILESVHQQFLVLFVTSIVVEDHSPQCKKDPTSLIVVVGAKVFP